MNLARGANVVEPLRLVEVVPDPSSQGASGLRVHIGAVRIDVPVGFDEKTLVRLLDVLEAC